MIVAFALTASAFAGTWADWWAPPDSSPLTAEYEPAWSVGEMRRESRNPQDFIEPNRGYDGELVFHLSPGAQNPPGPLRVHLLHSVAHAEDINWPEGRLPETFVPMVRPEAALRQAVAESRFSVPSDFPLRIPVVRPRSAVSPAVRRSTFPPALFARYEVRDATGVLLLRGILPARKLSENSRSLVGRTGDDEVLKQMTRRSGTFERVDHLPDAMVAYRQVRAIWFTDELWANLAGREALARRLLLSGVRLTGETSLVRRIQAELGTASSGLAVAESALAASWHNIGDFSLRTLNRIPRQEDPPPRRLRPREMEDSLFENEANLFAFARRSYLRWTLGGLLVFALGAIWVLGRVFRGIKGEGRVAIWWQLPAWSLGCAALFWLGGLSWLERRPLVDATEYRLAVADWPEMHCRVVASAMTFTPGRPVWRLPSDAVWTLRRRERLDGWWARWDAWTDGPEMRLQLPRQLTGTTLELEAGWFEPTVLPVHLTPPEESAERRVIASETLDGVFLLANGKWRDLGAMQPGDSRSVGDGTPTPRNRLPGLPQTLQSRWEHEAVSGLSLVVAWRREAQPRVAPDWPDARTSARILWVMQWP